MLPGSDVHARLLQLIPCTNGGGLHRSTESVNTQIVATAQPRNGSRTLQAAQVVRMSKQLAVGGQQLVSFRRRCEGFLRRESENRWAQCASIIIFFRGVSRTDVRDGRERRINSEQFSQFGLRSIERQRKREKREGDRQKDLPAGGRRL